MQIQFRGFQSNSVNVRCNWNRNVMQKKHQLMIEESSQKELESILREKAEHYRILRTH